MTLGTKLYCARLKGKESVILADTDIGSWKDAGTALADDDRSSLGDLSVVELGTKVLRVGIS